MIGILFEPTLTEPEKDQSYTMGAIFILSLLNLLPFLLSFILWNKKDKLDKQEVKEKYGALYSHFNPSKPSLIFYYLVFFQRRALFLLLTFIFLKRSGIQTEIMCYMTLIYICYIS